MKYINFGSTFVQKLRFSTRFEKTPSMLKIPKIKANNNQIENLKPF